MKAHYVRPYSKKELAIMGEQIEKEVNRGIQKALWLMCVAMNEAEGLGARRIMRILESLNDISLQYGGYKADGVADEILLKRIRQIGLPVNHLYGEDGI